MQLQTKFRLNKLILGLGIITIAELLLCGSGQVIKIGPLTARMVLFALCISVYSIYVVKYRPKLSKTDITLLGILTIWFFCNVCLGIISDAKIKYIIEDVKPLSYYFIFPFFLLIIKTRQVVNIINLLFRYIPLLMAIIYITYLIVMKVFGIVTFGDTYEMMDSESDFMFRGTNGELFYKGFIFLPIGLIFWIKEKKLLYCFIIAVAIFYTLTRGFYVITLLGVFLYMLYKAPNDKTRILILFGSFLGVLCIYLLMSQVDMGDRNEGDQLRFITVKQVLDSINGFSFWFGHGFGNGVPIRLVHMENSFLEIFHKTGIFGLSLWLYVLLCIFRNFQKSQVKDISVIYLIGSIMIYIQSLFNPYLINSMGMGFVLISYCVTENYDQRDKNSDLLCSI